MNTSDNIAEALAELRIHTSTHPQLAQDCNKMLDNAIIAVRDNLMLNKLSEQLFCARAHYGSKCVDIDDITKT